MVLFVFCLKKNLFSIKRILILVILLYFVVGFWGICYLKIIFFEIVKSVFKYFFMIVDIVVS